MVFVGKIEDLLKKFYSEKKWFRLFYHLFLKASISAAFIMVNEIHELFAQ